MNSQLRRYDKLHQLIISSPDQVDDPKNPELRMLIWNRNREKNRVLIKSNIPANSYCAVLLHLDHSNKFRRVIDILNLPFQVRLIERMMSNHSLEILGRFGAYPNLNDPFIVFSLKSPASKYTEKNILPDSTSGILGKIYKLLSWWSGCYPTIEGAFILGRKK